MKSKRSTRENVSTPLNAYYFGNRGYSAEKAEMLNAFFSVIFSAKTAPRKSQILQIRESLEERRLPLDQGGAGQIA